MDMEEFTFTDIFNIEEIQSLQDLFSEANEVASIITYPDGVPITKPSNFCRLCSEIIRNTEKGKYNCFKSDAEIGKHNPDGPIVKKCLSGGLWDAGVSITFGKMHLANWLIGQVKNEEISEETVLKYADEIGVNKSDFLEAFNEVPVMSAKKFEKIADMLFAFVNEISDKAFKNIQLKKEAEKREKAVFLGNEKEKELIIANNEIKFISENLPNIIWKAELTPEGKFENSYISEIVDEILGLPRGTINNSFEKYFSFIVPEYIPLLQEIIGLGIANPGKSYSCSYPVVKENKELIWVESNGRGYITDNKVQIFGITYDITEQKRTEDKLKESEYLLSQSQKVANIGSYVFDTTSGFWVCTPYLDQIFGIDDDYIKDVSGWLHIVHPDDREMIRQYLLNEVLAKHNFFDKEYRIKKIDDGQVIWVHGMGELKFDGSGNTVKMIGTIQNINSRKQVEELFRETEDRYRTLLENLPVGVFRSTLGGKVLSANPAMADIYRYNSVEELLNVPAADYYAEHNPREEMLKELRKKNYLLDYETLEYKKDGSLIWISANYKLIKGTPEDESFIDGVVLDVTERKRAEEAIQISEEKFRGITEQTNDLISLTDDKGIITYASPSAELLFGYFPEEMVGRNFIEFLEESDIPKAFEMFSKTIAFGESTRELELSMKRKNGSLFTGELSGSIFGTGNQNGTIVIIRDVTERKKAENEIIEAKIRAEQNEVRFKALHDASFGGIAIHDKGIILDCNNGLSQLTGFSREELVGMNGLLLIAEDYRKIVLNNILAEYEKAYEVFGLRKNGEVYPVRIQGKEIPYKGKIVRVTEFRDITEIKKSEKTLKQSEENFRLLVSNTFDGILISDKNGDYLYANKKAAEITGYSVEELTKINTRQLTPKMYLSSVEKRMKSQFNKKEKLSNFESALVHKSGKEIQIEIASSITTWKGVQAQIISFRDVTERKRKELELIEAKQKAEESDRLKSAFLANMSHEIRTPMNGILGFTSLLQEPGLTGEEQQSYIEIIKKSGDRMLNTVNDIIEISKIETGQVGLSLKEININEQLDFLYNFFKPEVEEKSMKMYLENELPESDAIIKTDEQKLNSILTNLIKNAIKYSNEGTITIRCEKQGKHLKIYINDNGIGIPQNRLQAIFDRFVQADIEDTRVHEGSGLGLAISKSYVKMLGGEIWVESQEGIGSTFYFTIDYNPVNGILEDIESAKMDEIKMEINKVINILIVEDDDVSSMLIENILSDKNYKFLRANNGKEAVDMVRNQPEVDLVLMDIKMPGMDGIEATKLIREFNKSILIIAQTAYALEGDKERALNAGCNDYISKPINKSELFHKLEKTFSK